METDRERILRVIAEAAGYEAADLKLADNLQADLGMDSLDMTNLAIDLEEEFKVELSQRSFMNVHTVGGLIAFILREVA